MLVNAPSLNSNPYASRISEASSLPLSAEIFHFSGEEPFAASFRLKAFSISASLIKPLSFVVISGLSWWTTVIFFAAFALVDKFVALRVTAVLTSFATV